MYEETISDIKGTVMCQACIGTVTRPEVLHTTFGGWDLITGNTGMLDERRGCELCKQVTYVRPLILVQRVEAELV